MSDMENMTFAIPLENWYLENKRDLPWRNTTDPYVIWVSEIILQQTRVVQGLGYFNRFMFRFPNVTALAEAEEDEVLKYWQGLGYYSRARNLHTAARQIMNDFGGRFPGNYKGVLSLKGIGEYTAAAICSFAYRQPYAVVDGNVYRVLSRLFDIDVPIDSTQGKKLFADLASRLLDKKIRMYIIRLLWSWVHCNVYPVHLGARSARYRINASLLRPEGFIACR